MKRINLKKKFTFLYVPSDHGASRPISMPVWGILVGGGVFGAILVMAVFYGLGLKTGSSWVPGGSALTRENHALKNSLVHLEEQVERLRNEIDSVFEVQNLVASSMDMSLVDRETFAAGIGGRGPLLSESALKLEYAPGGDAHHHGPDADIDQMLRQARIQRQGYLALLDTFSARESVRQHIPSIRPLDIGWMSSRFGFRDDPFTGKQTFHRGVDFSVPVGTPVYVTGDGVVKSVQQQRGFGRVIKVDHGNGVTSVYAHLDKILVKKGARVSRGDLIARSGNSGRSSAPHLHYEVRIGGRPVNPATYILDNYALRS